MREFYAESSYSLDTPWAIASFSTLLGNRELGGVWIAEAGSTAAGHAVLTVRYTMEHGALGGYIDDLFVRPDFRKLGIGYALVSALVEECRRRGCKSIHVEVGDSNSAALRLYGRFGLMRYRDGRILLSGEL